MRLQAFSTFVALATGAVALAFTPTIASAATDPAPAPSSTAEPVSGSLPLIGRVRAATPFCHTIVDAAALLAVNQLADIRTTTEALRILAYAPLDQNFFTERRAVRALETLSARLMESRRGDAQVQVAGLRKAARGGADEAPRPDLTRFAGALDGAHSESSRVAHEISRALSVLEEPDAAFGGVYLPDDELASDPRFAAALEPVPFPVDAELESFPAGSRVENGPLHAYARSVALQVARSLAQMLESVDEARRLFPTAFVECADVDARPSPAASAGP